MSKQKMVIVNDKQYVINAFLGLKGWQIKMRLVKYLGHFIGALPQMLEGGEKNEEETLAIMIGAFQDLLESAAEAEVTKLIQDILSGVWADGVEIDFDKEFQQNYSAIFKLAKEVIMHNYKDVFPSLDTIAD